MSGNFVFQLFHSLRKTPQYLLDRRLGGPSDLVCMLWQRGISYNSQEYNPSHPSFTEWIRNSVELDQKF